MNIIEVLDHKRSSLMFKTLKEMAYNEGFSNIGIPLDD